MAVTMHDVARLAEVSIKTVSNVLNDYPHVRPATRDRVLQAVDELGYRLNTSARNLRRGRTGLISLAVPELALPYFAELANEIIDAAESHHLRVLIERTGADPQREREVLRDGFRTGDGLLFSPLGLTQDDEAELPSDLRLVLLGERIFSERFDHVTMQNVEAARAGWPSWACTPGGWWARPRCACRGTWRHTTTPGCPPTRASRRARGCGTGTPEPARWPRSSRRVGGRTRSWP